MKGYLRSPTHITNSHPMPRRLFVFLSFFFGVIKAVGFCEEFYLIRTRAVVCGAGKGDVKCRRGHTHARLSFVFTLAFHTQPAAGKSSANYSPGAAFAAQPSMLFDAICLEFEKLVSLIYLFIYLYILAIIPFVPTALLWYKMSENGWMNELQMQSAFKGLLLFSWINNVQ